MVNKWELAGKVRSSSYRLRILSKLLDSNKTPTQLSKELNIKMSHISRALTELVKMGLIESLTPELRKGKMYTISKLGKEILKRAG